MHLQRPDIPFLVVESCSTSEEFLSRTPFLNEVRNVYTTSAKTNPQDFYRHAKITLVPSLFDESFGRVAAESMMAGVPVIGSRRGALPTTIASEDMLVTVPDGYTPFTKTIPTSKDAEPWVNKIIELWNNSVVYERCRRHGLERAHEWDYSKVLQMYETQLTSLIELDFHLKSHV